jgi:hypothetical protein
MKKEYIEETIKKIFPNSNWEYQGTFKNFHTFDIGVEIGTILRIQTNVINNNYIRIYFYSIKPNNIESDNIKYTYDVKAEMIWNNSIPYIQKDNIDYDFFEKMLINWKNFKR